MGNKTPTMETRLLPEEQIVGFELINIRDLPVGNVLGSEIPEEIVLAILTDYPQADTERVIVWIIEKLRQTPEDKV